MSRSSQRECTVGEDISQRQVCTFDVGGSEETYPVVQQTVPDVDRCRRCLRDAVPAVRLLRDCAARVVVPVEWVERAKLRPPVAELLVRVPVEPAHVRADHRDLEELELEDALDAVVQVRPAGEVVAEPVAHPLARRWERAATNNEGALSGVEVEEGQVRRAFFHEGVEIVRVDLYHAVDMRRVGGEGLVVEVVQAGPWVESTCQCPLY